MEKMASMHLLSFLIYLVLFFLCDTSYAWQHRHLRRALLYRGQDEAGKAPSLQEAGENTQEFNMQKTKLDANLVLDNSPTQLLGSGSIQRKKGRRRLIYRDIEGGNDGGNASSSSSLEQLKQSLHDLLSSTFGDKLEQTVQFLYDLLSPSFGANRGNSALTTVYVTATATSTIYSTTTTARGAESITSTTSAISTLTTVTTTTTTTPGAALTEDTTSQSSNATTTTTSTSTSSSAVISSSSTSAPTPSTPTRYNFDPMSSSNVAVYYGQTNQTGAVPFSTVCNDSSVDIIILAFVNKLSVGSAGYPGLDMGPNCWAPNDAQVAARATGLIDCVSDGFADEVKSCQETGKKVLLSIGGAVEYSETTIASETDSVRIADNIWNIFGAGGIDDDTIMPIRPFGDVVFDGFDIDNEDASTLYWPTLISTLRTHFSESTSTSTNPLVNKPYYLTAAPQCPRPDASIPSISLLTTIDFIFIQFYNNPSCQLSNPAGFLASLQAWSADISTSTSSSGFINIGNGVSSPRLYIGAYAFQPETGSGYVNGDGLVQMIQEVRELGLGNLGGVMFWDGAWGVLSEGQGSEGCDGASVDEGGEAILETRGTFMGLVKDALD